MTYLPPSLNTKMRPFGTERKESSEGAASKGVGASCGMNPDTKPARVDTGPGTDEGPGGTPGAWSPRESEVSPLNERDIPSPAASPKHKGSRALTASIKQRRQSGQATGTPPEFDASRTIGYDSSGWVCFRHRTRGESGVSGTTTQLERPLKHPLEGLVVFQTRPGGPPTGRPTQSKPCKCERPALRLVPIVVAAFGVDPLGYAAPLVAPPPS
jgi:hypothetical protein